MERNKKNIMQAQIMNLLFSILQKTKLCKLRIFDVWLLSKFMLCGVKHIRELYHKCSVLASAITLTGDYFNLQMTYSAYVNTCKKHP
jgi:hypothetical protein